MEKIRKVIWTSKKKIAEYFGIKNIQNPLVKDIQDKAKLQILYENKKFRNTIGFMDAERQFIENMHSRFH